MMSYSYFLCTQPSPSPSPDPYICIEAKTQSIDVITKLTIIELAFIGLQIVHVSVKIQLYYMYNGMHDSYSYIHSPIQQWWRSVLHLLTLFY